MPNQSGQRGGLKSFGLELSRGNIPGMQVIHKFGHNQLITTATDPEDIWDAGGIWVPPTTARTHVLVSSDDEDGGAGTDTGMLSVTIEGLDANGLLQEEVVTLNGTTNVNTASTYTIIHRMTGLTWGSANNNVGNITATAATDSTVTAQITATFNQTGMAIYRVPSDKTAYITNFWGALDDAGGNVGNADLDIIISPAAFPLAYEITQFHGLVTVGSSHFNHVYPIPQRVEAGSTLKMHVPEVSANADVAAGFDVILVDD